tara:strand:- start:326 stop:493 length:168 start_codon:yes stop_codon:yes gene_type:complete
VAITTKEQALNKMKPDGSMTLQQIIDDFVSRGFLTESEVKEQLKKSYPDVTDWGF